MMGFNVTEQMNRSRYNHKKECFERFENGEWVPWPVLRINKIGIDEANRVITYEGGRR
jgi:hypothetical protein